MKIVKEVKMEFDENDRNKFREIKDYFREITFKGCDEIGDIYHDCKICRLGDICESLELIENFMEENGL